MRYLVLEKLSLLTQGGQKDRIVIRSQVSTQQHPFILLNLNQIWPIIDQVIILIYLLVSLLLKLLVFFSHELKILEQIHLIFLRRIRFILLNVELNILQEFNKFSVFVFISKKLLLALLFFWCCTGEGRGQVQIQTTIIFLCCLYGRLIEGIVFTIILNIPTASRLLHLDILIILI